MPHLAPIPKPKQPPSKTQLSLGQKSHAPSIRAEQISLVLSMAFLWPPSHLSPFRYFQNIGNGPLKEHHDKPGCLTHQLTRFTKSKVKESKNRKKYSECVIIM